MKRWTFLNLCVAAGVASVLNGCGGESAHVSAGLLQPDPQPASAAAAPGPAAQRECAIAGMMKATPSGREALCRLNN